MSSFLSSILGNLYWIDIIVVCSLVAATYFHVLLRAKQIRDANQGYNAQLTAMRTEIYTEYEKNFFL